MIAIALRLAGKYAQFREYKSRFPDAKDTDFRVIYQPPDKFRVIYLPAGVYGDSGDWVESEVI